MAVRTRKPGSTCSTRSRTRPRCAEYHLLPSVRGDLLVKLGRREEAQAEFERAAELTRNARERELSLARARDAAEGSGGMR